MGACNCLFVAFRSREGCSSLPIQEKLCVQGLLHLVSAFPFYGSLLYPPPTSPQAVLWNVPQSCFVEPKRIPSSLVMFLWWLMVCRFAMSLQVSFQLLLWLSPLYLVCMPEKYHVISLPLLWTYRSFQTFFLQRTLSPLSCLLRIPEHLLSSIWAVV